MEPITLLAILAFAQLQNTTQQPAFTGMLPDNMFYPAKLLWEDMQVNFATNDTAKAQLQTKFADRRVLEAETEIQKGDFTSATKAQQDHDNRINKVQQIQQNLPTDNKGQQMKIFISNLLAQHDKKIGDSVSAFAQTLNGQTTIPNTILSNFKSKSDDANNQGFSIANVANPNMLSNGRMTPMSQGSSPSVISGSSGSSGYGYGYGYGSGKH